MVLVATPVWGQVQRLQPMFPRGGVPPGWVGTWDYGTLPPTMVLPNGQVVIRQPGYVVPQYRADPGAEGYRDGSRGMEELLRSMGRDDADDE